ncbi:hypothetical protein L7F22_014596 [Adiantum nelumboides]|nr:hypothetical protein [Adiantum nelumboides]
MIRSYAGAAAMKKKRLKRSHMQDARCSVGLANTAADQSRRRRSAASRAVLHQYYGTRAPAIAGVKICPTFDRTNIVASEAVPAGSLLKELGPPPATVDVGHAGADHQQAEGRRPQHMVHEGEVEELQAGFPSTPPAAHTFTNSESCHCDHKSSNYTGNEKLSNACIQLGVPPAQRNVDSHDQQVAIACHACATPTPYIDQYRRLHTADDIVSEINGCAVLQECIKCAACNRIRSYDARAGSTTRQVNPHGSQLPPPAPRKPKAQPRRSWIHRPSFFIPPDLELFFSSTAQPHNRITLMSD